MENRASNLNALIGICDSLKNEYGYDIYTDKIQQGFKEPCFFVETVSTNQRRIGYRRYERTQAFCIHYFPEESNSVNDDCLIMGENLLFLLEYIKIGEHQARGHMMRYDISGEVLNFHVNYNYHLIMNFNEPLMENLNQMGGIKNGIQGRNKR